MREKEKERKGGAWAHRWREKRGVPALGTTQRAEEGALWASDSAVGTDVAGVALAWSG
jgi:hypothetical protein